MGQKFTKKTKISDNHPTLFNAKLLIDSKFKQKYYNVVLQIKNGQLFVYYPSSVKALLSWEIKTLQKYQLSTDLKHLIIRTGPQSKNGLGAYLFQSNRAEQIFKTIKENWHNHLNFKNDQKTDNLDFNNQILLQNLQTQLLKQFLINQTSNSLANTLIPQNFNLVRQNLNPTASAAEILSRLSSPENYYNLPNCSINESIFNFKQPNQINNDSGFNQEILDSNNVQFFQPNLPTLKEQNQINETLKLLPPPKTRQEMIIRRKSNKNLLNKSEISFQVQNLDTPVTNTTMVEGDSQEYDSIGREITNSPIYCVSDCNEYVETPRVGDIPSIFKFPNIQQNPLKFELLKSLNPQSTPLTAPILSNLTSLKMSPAVATRFNTLPKSMGNVEYTTVNSLSKNVSKHAQEPNFKKL